jgi:hypothetical protein
MITDCHIILYLTERDRQYNLLVCSYVFENGRWLITKRTSRFEWQDVQKIDN